MSTLNRATLRISVVDLDRRPIKEASVRVVGQSLSTLDSGLFLVRDVRAGRTPIRVEATGFAPAEFVVEVTDRDVAEGTSTVDVVLGEPGLPSYYRRGVPVPFRSPDNQLGVVTRGSNAAAAIERFVAERKRNNPNLTMERLHGRDLTVISCSPPELEGLATELRAIRGVAQVGRLVNPGGKGTGLLTRRIVVRAQPGTTDAQVTNAAQAADCTVVRKLGIEDFWLLELKSGEGFAVLEAASKLAREAVVQNAEPDVAFTADPDSVNPTDQLYAAQWHLSRVNAPDAWQNLRDGNPAGVNPGDPGDLTFGAASILLAVMDTGVKSVTPGGGAASAAHPEFQGAVSNGQSKVTAFFDFGAMVPNCDDPEAVFGDAYHGSACAGVAAARADNASGVAGEDEGGCGAAPNCRILAVQGPNPCTEAEYSDMYLWIAGIDPGNPDPAFPAQLAQGADVITNSWGGYNPAVWPISTLMDTLFTTITDDGRGGRGALMFFSAGNASSANFWTLRPFAAHARNFGIAASTDGDVKASYSNWGDGIDLCAPSSGGANDITTTTIPGAGGLAGHTGGPLDYISTFGGTSSATPLIAGVAALLLSMDPTLTHQEAREILTRTAKKIDYANADVDGLWRDVDGDGVKEYSWWYGFGMVDAAKAVCVARNTIAVDPAVQFVDVPENEPAIRPVLIRVKGWRPRNFTTPGPITITGPAGSFTLHAGAAASYAGSYDCAETHVFIWIRYTGTVDGDVATGSVTVTCTETGEVFPVTLTANTIARPKAALVLALDRSGSMNDPAGDGRLKIQLVRDSAAVVPVLCDEGTGLGGVRWDTDADLAGAMHVIDAGPELGGAGRTALTGFVAAHATNVFGATAIGDAVEAAQTLADEPTGYAVRAMCILTDGNETASKYISDLAPSELNSRIFAIGVGTPENIQPSALAQLTGSNSGYLLLTGTLDANDTFLVTKYFQQILAGVTNTEIVVDPQGVLHPSTPLRLPFPVNDTDRQIDVIVHCAVPSLLRFRIEAPDGQIFGPGQATTVDARYVAGSGSVYYRLDMPSSIVGPQDPSRPWHALLQIDPKRWDSYLRRLAKSEAAATSIGAAVNGLRYAFTMQARSSLRMDVTVTQSSREPGATAWIRAGLLEYGQPLQISAKVWAEISSPKGDLTTVPLKAMGGGVYQSSLLANLTGAWRVTVKAAGKTTLGNPFMRESIRSIVVWPGGDRPGPSTPPSGLSGQLFECLCSGKVVDPEVAHKFGIDLKRLCECVKSKRTAQTQP
jgi:subtilisin family serine protease